MKMYIAATKKRKYFIFLALSYGVQPFSVSDAGMIDRF